MAITSAAKIVNAESTSALTWIADEASSATDVSATYCCHGAVDADDAVPSNVGAELEFTSHDLPVDARFHVASVKGRVSCGVSQALSMSRCKRFKRQLLIG